MRYDEQPKVRSIKGTITLTDGTESEFRIINISGDPAWFQGGDADTERLSRTVDVLDSMQEAVAGYLVDDRDDDDKCSKCGADLDDGQGYDGKCGDCADKDENEEE